MPDKETTTLRSDFLVHWTGWDIEEKYRHHPQARREEYVNRIRNTVIPSNPNDPKTNGLWMTEREEVIYKEKGVEHALRHHIPKTCFTEVKLSLTRRHTERYGCLGFGFSRAFVLERDGAPVFYVDRGTERGGILQHFIRQFITIQALQDTFAKAEVRKAIQESGVIPMIENDLLSKVRCHRYAPFLRPAVLQRLEDRLQECLHEKNIGKIFFDFSNSVANNMLFIKPISDRQDPRDYTFLDEAEWRIVMPLSKSNPLFHYPKREEWPPKAKIWFGPTDLKVLILPDDKTRRQALDKTTASGQDIVDWLFRDPASVPIIATVEECLQF